MKGVYDWLEYVNYNTVYGPFWDPSREIRSQIEKDLAMISGKEVDWQRLLASGDWLGRKLEQEVELARQDERRQRDRDFDRRSGVFLGIGF